jgi:hypothetical protein
VNRRLLSLVAVVATTTLAVAPAHAATKKKPKPKPIRGSYSVTLLPDPTADAFSSSGQKNPAGDCGLLPNASDKHPFKVPAAGTLHVVLNAANPLPTTTAVGPDWDLHILDADGSELDASTSSTSHEETTDKFKRPQPLTIEVCNITGQPNATVTYVFTYA